MHRHKTAQDISAACIALTPRVLFSTCNPCALSSPGRLDATEELPATAATTISLDGLSRAAVQISPVVPDQLSNRREEESAASVKRE